MRPTLFFTFLILFANPCFAQQPHVDTLWKNLDTNGDGTLTQSEVAKNQRYSRQFPRWDSDGDGEVSKQDIIEFRAKFGIAADGTMIHGDVAKQPKPSLTIPDVSSLARMDKQTKLDRNTAANSQYVLKTTPHPVQGNHYYILTDHRTTGYLESLARLAQHRDAKTITVDDLGVLHEQPERFADVRSQLIAGGAKYVAIAPRMESFRENMLLGMWELLSTLDQDPQLDCFPGFLLASNEASFARLIDQSITHQPISRQQLKPYAINQVQNSRETRSLQKSAILQKHFQKVNLETPIVAIYGQSASEAPRLEGKQIWNLTVQSKRKFITNLPPAADAAFQEANLVIMHGHGIPGMSCSFDVDGLSENMTGKVLLTGSCFSASPAKSDLAAVSQAPGGYDVEPRDAFILARWTMVRWSRSGTSDSVADFLIFFRYWKTGSLVKPSGKPISN